MPHTRKHRKVTKNGQLHSIVGRTLHNGEYLIQAALGNEGAGSTAGTRNVGAEFDPVMAHIFQASHVSLDMPLTIKQVPADAPLPEVVISELDAILSGENGDRADSLSFPPGSGPNIDRFLREALLLARLSHPAIPVLYDYFFEDGYWYLVTEYLIGQTLAAHIRQHAPLPAREAIYYAMQLCDLLDYLHTQSPPVIFSNLKPSNVILIPDNRLKLLDLSKAYYFTADPKDESQDALKLAPVMNRAPRIHREAMMELTASGYVAPEYYDEPGKLDERSDLFSLGIMLHEMISGLSPLAKGGTEGITGELESLRRVNPDLSPVLSGLVTMATRTEPERRFQSAYAFYLALRRAYAIEGRRASYVAGPEADTRGRLQNVTPTGGVAPRHWNMPRETQTGVVSPQFNARSNQGLYPSGDTPTLDSNVWEERPSPTGIPVPRTGCHKGPSQGAIPRVPTPPSPLHLEMYGRGLPPPGTLHSPRKSKVARRVLYTCFVIALLLSLVMTSLLIYGRIQRHPTSTPSGNAAEQASTSTSSTPSPSIGPEKPPIYRGTWQVLPSLPAPEADNAAIYVEVQGHAYVYMNGAYHGHTYAPHYDHSLYRYDIAAARWETLVNGSFPAMINSALATDGKDRLFFTAAYSPDISAVASLLYMYRLSDGMLQKIVPPADVSIGFGAAMVADQEGNLYITQGFMSPGDPQGQAGADWYRYNIDSNQWNVLTPLPVGLGYVVLALDGSGGIVMLGGAKDSGQSLPTAQIYRYDITSNRWTVEQKLAPEAFSGAASCSDGSGDAVIIGGSNGLEGGQQRILNASWLVNLRTLRWEPLASLPSGGSLLGAAACDGAGHVFLARGANDPSRPTVDFLMLTIR